MYDPAVLGESPCHRLRRNCRRIRGTPEAVRIEQVRIRGIRALKQRTDSLLDGVRPRVATCLRGTNGSGKTTYLTVLAGLWQWFRRCVGKGGYATPAGFLKEAVGDGVAAMEVSDLPGPCPRLWLAVGNVAAIPELAACEGFRVVEGKPTWDKEVLAWWGETFERVENGFEAATIPNIVWIEAENKWVPELRAGELDKPAREIFPAVARYLPTASHGRSHLEGLLLTLYLARRSHWQRLQAAIAELRPGLALLDDFDVTTRRPRFMRDGVVLTVDLLSAGERSLLINLAMILRWLGPGGVVLFDEPELHQHLSLMRGSLAVLESVVTANDLRGQLIVASHAPEVWAHFPDRTAIIDLDNAS